MTPRLLLILHLQPPVRDVHLGTTLIIDEPPLLAVLHGHSYPQRERPSKSMVPHGHPKTQGDPSGSTYKDWTNLETKWMEQVARHLVQTPGRLIYPPSTSGQYALRLRSQLMLPPAGTMFVLVPTIPLTRADLHCARPIPIHRLVAQLLVQSHVYLAFVSLPEAIFHANHTVRYPVSIRAVGGETTPARFQNLLDLKPKRYSSKNDGVVGESGTQQNLDFLTAALNDIWAVIARDEVELPTEAALPQVGGACRDPMS